MPILTMLVLLLLSMIAIFLAAVEVDKKDLVTSRSQPFESQETDVSKKTMLLMLAITKVIMSIITI